MVQNIKCLKLLPILWVVHKKLEKLKRNQKKYILMKRTWSMPRKLPKKDWNDQNIQGWRIDSSNLTDEGLFDKKKIIWEGKYKFKCLRTQMVGIHSSTLIGDNGSTHCLWMIPITF